MPGRFIAACCSEIERTGRKTAAFRARTNSALEAMEWHMRRVLLAAAVIGCAGGFAALAMAQSKEGDGLGDVSSVVAKLEAQCAHRRAMPPDPRDDCARKLREAQRAAGVAGAGNGAGQGAAAGLGVGPGNGAGNGIGPGSGGGLAKGKK
jgi:hypothetical protein